MNKGSGSGAHPRDGNSGYAGRGMGGGGMYGARPDYKPQIPDEFKEIMRKKKEAQGQAVVA
jgi:hypothetical protein